MRVLGQKSTNEVDLLYSHAFIYLSSQMNKPVQFLGQTFKSFRAFSHIDFAVKQSRSTQDHHLNNYGSAGVLNAAYQVSRQSANWFWS